MARSHWPVLWSRPGAGIQGGGPGSGCAWVVVLPLPLPWALTYREVGGCCMKVGGGGWHL